jgi:hypothetical protein
MPAAFVKSASTGSTAASPTTGTFSAATTSGNSIIIGIGDDSALTTPISSVTDNKGNTYSRTDTVKVNASSIQMWAAHNIVGGSSHTITVAWSATATGRVVVLAQEFSGLATTSTLDRVASATGSSTTASGGTTASITQANELVVMCSSHSGTTAAYTVGSGYSNLITVNVANAATAMQSKVVSAVGTQTGTMTIATSRIWVGIIATFKAADGATPMATGNWFALL